MDILNILIGILGTVVGGVLTWIITTILRNNVKNNHLKLKKASSNILLHIVPKSSMSHAKELLRAPYSECDTQWSYKFKNALLQLRSKDGKSIDSILLLIPKIKRNSRFQIPSTDFKLGKISLANVVQDNSTFRRDTSSKHCLISTERYNGNPGNYWFFTYGIFIGPGAEYPNDLIEWDYDRQIVSSDLNRAKINFVCISEIPEQGYFDFSAF